MTTADNLYQNFQASATLVKDLGRILNLQFIVTVLLNSRLHATKICLICA